MKANRKRSASQKGKAGKVRKGRPAKFIAHSAVEERHITERKQVEAELLKLRKAVLTSGEVVFMVDCDGLFTFVNPEFTRLYGYTAAEVIGKTTPRILKSGVVKPEDYGIFWQTLLNKQVVKRELINKTKDGRFVTVGVSVNPILDDDGNITGFLAIQRDISERKQAEETLQQSEAFIKAVMENLPIGVAVNSVDPSVKFDFMNDKFVKYYRTTKEAISGADNFWTAVYEDPQFREEIKKRVLHDCASGDPTTMHWEDVPITRKGEETSFITARNIPLAENKLMISTVLDVTKRKRSEEALKLFRTLIDRTNDAIEVLDPQTGRYLDINKKACLDLGYSREELLGLSVFDIDPTVDQLSFTRESEELRKSGAMLWEGVHRRKDGSTFPVEVNLKYVQLDRDYIVAVVRDITERKRAVEALAQERNMLRTLIDNLPDRVYVKDTESRFLLNNVAHMRALGAKSIEELVGKRDFDYRSLELAKRQYADDRSVLQSGKPMLDQEESTILGNGEKGWLLSTKVPLRDSNGNVTGIVGISRDITERKQADDVIRRQQAYFQNLFENSTIAIAMLDKSEVILEINKAFELAFQYSKEEIAGRNINDVIVPDSLKEEGKELTEMARNKQNIQKETVRKRKDGKLVNVSVHGFPIIINGELVGIYGIYEDISERKKLEKQFLHAQRLESVGTLAGGIAHDFNNILGIIMAYTSILLRGGTKPEETSSYLSTILNAVERGTMLSRQILTFARKGDAIMEDVRVNDVLKDLDKMMQETFPKNIEIRFDLDSSISTIAMDSGQFHQAMLNLCVNARDAVLEAVKQGSGNGLISIKTRLVSAEALTDYKIQAPMGSYVAITVSDTGAGMNEETKQRIFEPFFTTKDLGRGTGLGLAVVYGIVKSHQGFIDVKSEIGRGTDFVLYFPARRSEAKGKTPLTQVLREAPGGSETILLVEDEMVLMELLKNLLLNKGYDVLTAANGLEAVEVFARNKNTIRLVLSDHGLPKLGGIEAFKKMKKMNPIVKAILASGYIEPNQKSEILKSGIKEFVQKPYDPQEVLRKVREVLDIRA